MPHRPDRSITSHTKLLPRKRINDLASVPDRQMNMGKLRLAGKPHESKRRSAIHWLTDMDPDTPFPQMTVLCLPAFRMIDHNSISALAASSSSARLLTYESSIFHPVAHTSNRAGSACQHRDPLFHRTLISDRKIHPIVTVVGAGTAAEILRGGGLIGINVVRHPTGLAYATIEREGEFKGGGKWRIVTGRPCSVRGRADSDRHQRNTETSRYSCEQHDTFIASSPQECSVRLEAVGQSPAPTSIPSAHRTWP